MKKIKFFALSALLLLAGCESLPDYDNYDSSHFWPLEVDPYVTTGTSVVLNTSYGNSGVTMQISESSTFSNIIKEFVQSEYDLISGLKPHTTYYVRCYLPDPLGGKAYSSTGTFATNNVSMEISEMVCSYVPNTVPDHQLTVRVRVNDYAQLPANRGVQVCLRSTRYLENDGLVNCNDLGNGIWEYTYPVDFSEMPFVFTATPELYYWNNGDGKRLIEAGETVTRTITPNLY